VELGAVESGGLRKISEKISGFEIRYALGIRGGLSDVDVYDANGAQITRIERLDARPTTCNWNRDRTAIVINGKEYPLKQ
jgi:hypothetical protein